MLELPDLAIYQRRLDERIVGARLRDIRLGSPFVLRSATPAIEAVRGRAALGARRLPKQLVIELEGDCFVVMHLMIAGRLHLARSRRSAAAAAWPSRFRLCRRHDRPR